MHTGTHIIKVLTFLSSLNLSKTLGAISASVLAVVLNLLPLLVALAFLILIDLRFGLRVYMHEKKKEGILESGSMVRNITSEGLRKSASKAADYLFIILTVVCLETLVLRHLHVNITWEALTVSTVTVGLLCFIEVWSIGENFKKLRGFNVFRYLIMILQGKKNEVIENHKKINE